MNRPALVVLAAGMSTRYGKLKQVDPLGPDGASIMDYNVYDAGCAGFGKIVYVVRPEIEERIHEHVERVIGDCIPVAFVRQTLDRIPEGFSVPPDRVRPWGTGQAVLCAADEVRGLPFGVCNADDLYGGPAFRSLFTHLSAEPAPTEAAMVGYRLRETLSEGGGVSRGICMLGRDRRLERVTEVREIHRVGRWIEGIDPNGAVVELQEDDVVSMNLWGFTDPVLDALERQFARFLGGWGADTVAEFPLSTALSRQVQRGTVGVAVLPGGDSWFGVTHPSDREEAAATLAERIEAGDYPEYLTAAFRQGA